jgi:hypothetical protein
VTSAGEREDAAGDAGNQLLMPRNVGLLDAAVAVWIAAWLVVAVIVMSSLRELGEVGDTVVAAAGGLEDTSAGLRRVSGGLRETGRALSTLGALPLVGDLGPRVGRAATEVDRIAARVDAAADEARVSAATTRDDVNDLALVVGIAIAAVGTLPPLLMYLLIRPLLLARTAPKRDGPLSSAS